MLRDIDPILKQQSSLDKNVTRDVMSTILPGPDVGRPFIIANGARMRKERAIVGK